MTAKEQIDYMIQSLQVAKDEIDYAEKYMKKKKTDDCFYNYGHMGYGRVPNGAIIRESLRMVGRIAGVVANKVSLSPYCDEVFKGE